MNAKPFFVLLFFLLLLILFASRSLSTTDLTPDTTPVPGSLRVPGSGGAGPLSAGQESNSAIYATVCGATHTVVKGDTLYSIGRACGLTVDQIMALNPIICNPNLIRPGDVLTLAVGGAPAAVPATQPPAAANPLGVVPETGIAPGGVVTVNVKGFAPLSMVDVYFGPLTGTQDKVKQVQVDKNGAYTGVIGVPPSAKAGELWVVRIVSVSDPNQAAQSQIFEIDP